MKINKREIWNDYLLTLAVRGVGGAILGVIAGILLGYRGILHALGEDHIGALGNWFLISLGIGFVVGMVTSPAESHPWKRIKTLEERLQETRNQRIEVGGGKREQPPNLPPFSKL